MAAFSIGGAVTHLGFGVLAVLVMATTGMAFALIFAGVTLRIELPLLIAAYGGAFEPAYQWIAWLSWAPNLAWAEWWVRRSRGVGMVPAPSRVTA